MLPIVAPTGMQKLQARPVARIVRKQALLPRDTNRLQARDRDEWSVWPPQGERKRHNCARVEMLSPSGKSAIGCCLVLSCLPASPVACGAFPALPCRCPSIPSLLRVLPPSCYRVRACGNRTRILPWSPAPLFPRGISNLTNRPGPQQVARGLAPSIPGCCAASILCLTEHDTHHNNLSLRCFLRVSFPTQRTCPYRAHMEMRNTRPRDSVIPSLPAEFGSACVRVTAPVSSALP